MLQKEVVDRLAAEPGSKSYGRISVGVQQACRVTPVVSVPPSAFTPPPKVESSVVRLEPYKDSPHPVKDKAQLHSLCLTAFNQRRKTIRNNLKQLVPAEQLEALGINLVGRLRCVSRLRCAGVIAPMPVAHKADVLQLGLIPFRPAWVRPINREVMIVIRPLTTDPAMCGMVEGCRKLLVP